MSDSTRSRSRSPHRNVPSWMLDFLNDTSDGEENGTKTGLQSSNSNRTHTTCNSEFSANSPTISSDIASKSDVDLTKVLSNFMNHLPSGDSTPMATVTPNNNGHYNLNNLNSDSEPLTRTNASGIMSNTTGSCTNNNGPTGTFEEWYNEQKKLEHNRYPHQKMIKIAQNCVGVVLGKAGKTVVILRKATGCYININQSSSNCGYSMIEIKGDSLEKIEKCEKYVNKIVIEYHAGKFYGLTEDGNFVCKPNQDHQSDATVKSTPGLLNSNCNGPNGPNVPGPSDSRSLSFLNPTPQYKFSYETTTNNVTGQVNVVNVHFNGNFYPLSDNFTIPAKYIGLFIGKNGSQITKTRQYARSRGMDLKIVQEDVNGKKLGHGTVLVLGSNVNGITKFKAEITENLFGAISKLEALGCINPHDSGIVADNSIFQGSSPLAGNNGLFQANSMIQNSTLPFIDLNCTSENKCPKITRSSSFHPLNPNYGYNNWSNPNVKGASNLDSSVTPMQCQQQCQPSSSGDASANSATNDWINQLFDEVGNSKNTEESTGDLLDALITEAQ